MQKGRQRRTEEEGTRPKALDDFVQRCAECDAPQTAPEGLVVHICCGHWQHERDEEASGACQVQC